MEDISNNINFSELSQAIADKRLESPEYQHLSDKEVLSQIIRQHKNDQPTVVVPVPTTTQTVAPTISSNDEYDNLPDYAKDMPVEIKERVEVLIRLTLDKGIVYGYKRAQREDPAVLDMFHDALVDKLYEKIKELK